MTTPPHPVVALLSDFGTTDPFVGIMKGVVLAGCPDATLVDLSHGVPPQNVRVGAFWLERGHQWFPDGTIFVAVVDPGVGTERRGLVVEAHGKIFVAPDNGLIGRVASGAGGAAVALDWRAAGLPPPSRTFHGRDVFAPIAGLLASGRKKASELGTPVSDVVVLPEPRPTRIGDAMEGEVIGVDHFGNAMTNIEAAAVARGAVVHVCDKVVLLAGTYADVAVGDFVAVVNSFGMVEIARRDGNAAATLNLAEGSRVAVRPAH